MDTLRSSYRALVTWYRQFIYYGWSYPHTVSGGDYYHSSTYYPGEKTGLVVLER